MQHLTTIAPDGDDERMVWLRLNISTDFRPRSARERVDVFLDDHRVGWLSDTQSANMLPLVHFLNDHGKQPVARGVVGGSALKAELVLYVARASEVSREWIESQGGLPSGRASSRPEFMWDDDTD